MAHNFLRRGTARSMNTEQAGHHIVEAVRKLVRSPNSQLRHTTRHMFRRMLAIYDQSRLRKTGLTRILEDDGDELPGALDATAQPKCGHCGNQFRRRRKDQRYCSSECRKAAYNDRQDRIHHREPVC